MPNQSNADEIAKLHKLLKDGIISRQEFETVKRKIIEENAQPYRVQARPAPMYGDGAPLSPGQAQILVGARPKPRKASTVLLICGALLAVLFMGGVFDNADEDPSRRERTIAPTAMVASGQMSIALSSDEGSGKDETVYTDGVIGVLVTIADGANWVAEGEGCSGIGPGIAGDLHAGQLAAVAPVNSSNSRNVAFLSKGLMVYDGSCQFAFEANMFEADEYEITIWESDIVCQRTDMVESSTGLIAEVLIDENGMTCRNFSS